MAVDYKCEANHLIPYSAEVKNMWNLSPQLYLEGQLYPLPFTQF